MMELIGILSPALPVSTLPPIGEAVNSTSTGVTEIIRDARNTFGEILRSSLLGITGLAYKSQFPDASCPRT